MHRIITVLFCISIILTCLYVSPSQGQIINGDFSDGLEGWYTSGNVSTSLDGVTILRTGGVGGPYITSLSIDFVVSGERLTFRYYFDIVGPDDITYTRYPSYPPDSFQVVLDAGDEGYLSELLAWNPTGDFIPFSMDISTLLPGTRAMLSFMLLDEDDGNLSIAKIDDVSDPARPVPEPATLILLGGGLLGLFAYSRYSDIRKICLFISILLVMQMFISRYAYGELLEENVEDRTALEFTAPLFNTRTNLLTLNMTVANISGASIFTPMKVVITGISTPDVTVASPDGYTAEGLPFFDLTAYINDQELSPEEVTPSIRISFYNPRRVKFRWDQDVVAFIDEYTGRGTLIAGICLKPGEYYPVCEYYEEGFEVENSEFNMLLQNPLPEMYLYEQVRVYTLDNEDLPLRVTINDMEAIYNEDGFYYYSDLVLKEGLNIISIGVITDGGISASREISLNIDSVPPGINIIEPADGTIVAMPDLVINGTVDDPQVNKVTLIKDFISQEEVPVIDGVFNTTVTLSPGHNSIRIKATDMAGNSAPSDLDIVYVYLEIGDIEGCIINSIFGLPIDGATITAAAGSGDYRTTVSGEDGSYRLEGGRSGDITLSVGKDGYTPYSLRIFSPGGDAPYRQDVSLVPVNNPDTFTLTGQVKDTDGLPLSRARISVEGTPLAATSDSNGIYIITGIPRASFVAEASRDMYEGMSFTVDARMYSSNTTILVHNFSLKEIVSFIRVISPSDGGYVSGESVLVIGSVGSGDRDVGVRVNGILAQVYNGYFMANDIPLTEGGNRITAEMIDPSGTLLTDSVDVTLQQRDNMETTIETQEAGIVPTEISISIEAPVEISFEEYRMDISGPGTPELISRGPLQYWVFISEPGIYTLTFDAIDSAGNRYRDTFGFTGMVRQDIEEMLRLLWMGFKNYLVAEDVEKALTLFTPETRSRYEEQFLLLGDRISDVFANIGDIQLISLEDNVAKARVYEGNITHYVWFARDIYGLWRIHKF